MIRTSRSALLLILVASALASPPASGAAAPPEPPEPPDLSGRWALMQLQTRISEIPMVGDVTTGARSLALVQITQRGATLSLEERLCALRFESSSPSAVTKVLPSLARRLPLQRRPATLSWSGRGWSLLAPKHVAVHGAKLKAPATEALPKEASDPRVVDVDKDGLPGMTVQIDGIVQGRIGLVQRAWTLRRGVVRSADRVDGLVEGDREERYLRVTNPLLRLPVTSRVHPDRARHSFTLRRVDGKMTCPRLLTEASKLMK